VNTNITEQTDTLINPKKQIVGFKLHEDCHDEIGGSSGFGNKKLPSLRVQIEK
jgi:hypothetical protein